MNGNAVDALRKCAEALQHGNPILANAEMGRVLALAEKEIDPTTRRLIRYFAQALACRAYGLHPKYFLFPSSDWKHRMCYRYELFAAVGWAIADVIKEKRIVHVIELVKHMDGYEQWASILFHVDDRFDVIYLRLSFLVQENVEFSKQHEEELIDYAEDRGIKLEYKIFRVNSFADIDMSLLEIRDGEFVVVNCMCVFSKMSSEALALKYLLRRVRDVMRADVMIVVEHDANHHNQSDFLLRFDESLEYYSSVFQELNEYEDGYEFEIEAYCRYQICNMVACEGSNRVERHQSWVQWKSLLFRYGFSIFNLSNDFEEEYKRMKWENGILVIRTKPEKQPLFFISAWKTSTSPFKSSGTNEGPCIISTESNSLRTFQICPKDIYLIRMASLAELYDVLWNIHEQLEVDFFLTWANRTPLAHPHGESSSPLKSSLCIVDVSFVYVYSYLKGENELDSLEGGEGYVGKALKYNQPFYVPDINIKLKENVCPYINEDCKEDVLGALAIKLSNTYNNCDNYVVEFLFKCTDMTLENQKRLVHCVIDDLKDARLRFVTYGNQDPLAELVNVLAPAVSNTMLPRGNPQSQSITDSNLNGINQTVGNDMDVQRLAQEPNYSPSYEVMLPGGNLPSLSTEDLGLNGTAWIVDNPRDGNVLQMPREQATSNNVASRENLVALPIGDSNLNERISSSGINQTIGYHAMDKQGPHKQGTKRRRTLRSDVWDHFEKVVVGSGSLAKCKYCEFETDGSSTKGTTHLRKHYRTHPEAIKSVHQSSNLPSKNLETQSILREKFVLDQDKIHMDVAKMFIKYKLPLSIIQDEVFKNPFKRLQPEFELQSENDLGRSILDVYNREKERLLRCFDKFSCSFNLTINLWEDDTKKIVNCCLTVQFIDDGWVLRKKILSFERLKHDFDAKLLCKIFKRALLDWNIEEKTCSLTIHNSLSNVEIVHEEKIWPSGIFYLSYDKCIRDMNCMAADISLKSIYQVYKQMNHEDGRGYNLMNVECSNNWRICSFILTIVTVLHPFLKHDFVEFVYKEIYGDAVAKEHLYEMSNFLRSLYDKYTSKCSNHTKFATTFGDTSCCSSLSNADDQVLDSFRKYKASKRSRPELHQYLEKDEDSSMEIDILNWWCNNHSRFPTLGKMARDFLAIPLSTIVSSSAFAKEITKIISNNDDQEPQIINAMICCQDWLDSTKTSTCDEMLMTECGAWSKKYLLWDFTHEDLELLEKWKNPKITGERVGLVEEFKVEDKFLAPLVIPIIQGTPQAYYIGDEVINMYFLLLGKRSKEYPEMFLKHTSLDPLTASLLLYGKQASVPSWINSEEQINTCKLFLPLCFLNHWTLFYVDIKDQKFVWLDSRKGSEMLTCGNFQIIPKWFKDSLLPTMGLNNARDWPLFVRRDIPGQENEIDCGIFVMKYADCLTHANCIGFPFSQEDMPHFRERIFLDIYKGRMHVREKFVGS